MAPVAPAPPAAMPVDKAQVPALLMLLPPWSEEARGPEPLGALWCSLRDCGHVQNWTAPYFVAETGVGPSALPEPCGHG